MKKILIFIICLFAFPIISYGANCSNDKYTETSRLVNNVNITYEISINNNKPTFTIVLTNLTDDMGVVDLVTSKAHKNFKATGSELKITTSTSGRYSFDIYSLACKTKIGNKAVTLPTYNSYYNDELCKGLESYDLCKRWSSYKADRKTFENDIKKLKASLEKKVEKEDNTEIVHKKWYQIAVQVLLDYWWLFVIILSIIIGLCYFIRKQRKKNEYDFEV